MKKLILLCTALLMGCSAAYMKRQDLLSNDFDMLVMACIDDPQSVAFDTMEECLDFANEKLDEMHS